MPKAKEVAAELRKLAEHYDQFGEVEIPAPYLEFNLLSSSKVDFFVVAQAMPRPFDKKYETDKYGFVTLTHRGEQINVRAIAYRNAVCRVVKPAQEAVYECEPLLSEAEEAQINSTETAVA